jgi:hypothetical protein
MATTAVVVMVLAMVVIWGSLIAAAVFLAVRPEVSVWPPGGPVDEEDPSLDVID